MQVLLAERDIARALAAFARAMDAREWAALDGIIAAGATADFGTGPVRGRAAVVEVMRSFLDDCGPTQHLLGNLTVEVDGTRATSCCYVSDLHLGAGEKAALTFQTLGEYRDLWECRDGRWWLTQRVKLNRAHLGSFAVLGPGPKGWSPQ
ncbi:MAG: nuclear transport factor 2 family protein [Proteobacteria bacterium]|nr:nuclear transport factor 2 family protein [Pseudomonadota bacterium]